jgi:hypothetical protein
VTRLSGNFDVEFASCGMSFALSLAFGGALTGAEPFHYVTTSGPKWPIRRYARRTDVQREPQRSSPFAWNTQSMVSTQFDSDKSSRENNVVSMSRLIAQDAIPARGCGELDVRPLGGVPTSMQWPTWQLTRQTIRMTSRCTSSGRCSSSSSGHSAGCALQPLAKLRPMSVQRAERNVVAGKRSRECVR